MHYADLLAVVEAYYWEYLADRIPAVSRECTSENLQADPSFSQKADTVRSSHMSRNRPTLLQLCNFLHQLFDLPFS